MITVQSKSSTALRINQSRMFVMASSDPPGWPQDISALILRPAAFASSTQRSLSARFARLSHEGSCGVVVVMPTAASWQTVR